MACCLRSHRVPFLLLALAALSVPPAQAETSYGAERARIAGERHAIEARYAAEAAECRRHFVVSACLEDVRRRQRQALAAPRREELQLDDAERRRRAAERIEAVRARQAAMVARPPPAPASEPVPHAAEAPRPAASQAPRTQDATAKTAEAAAAARRAAAAKARREAAAADRARIAARQAQHRQEGQKSAPLPEPESASQPARR